jgi:hypothetical protein
LESEVELAEESLSIRREVMLDFPTEANIVFQFTDEFLVKVFEFLF